MTTMTDRLLLEYRLPLVCDMMRALQNGYELGETYAIVVRLDNPVTQLWAKELLPEHDWSQYAARGEVPLISGVAPAWLRETIDGLSNDLPHVRAASAESGKFPVVIFADGETQMYALDLPAVTE